ncbi:MAG: hypothetical protein U0795_05955 [Pirellulales bacterium]
MNSIDDLSHFDYRVLYWVAGSVRGATLQEVAEHEGSSRPGNSLADRAQILDSLRRLEALKLVHRDGERFRGNPQLHQIFLNESRNTRDTVEDVTLLQRLVRMLDKVDS